MQKQKLRRLVSVTAAECLHHAVPLLGPVELPGETTVFAVVPGGQRIVVAIAVVRQAPPFSEALSE